MGTMETLANLQLVRFQGFSEDLWTSQNFSIRKTWPRGLRHPLTQKCGTARNGLSLKEQARRPRAANVTRSLSSRGDLVAGGGGRVRPQRARGTSVGGG
jgi:hypothetical protein